MTIGAMKTILFIGTHFSVNHWIFIQMWRSCLCQYCRRCGPYFFNLFKRWRSWFRKYLYVFMLCAAWFRLPMRDSSLSVFILLNLCMLWCPVPRMSIFILAVIPVESGPECPIPDKYFVQQAELIPRSFGLRGGHLISVVHRYAAA